MCGLFFYIVERFRAALYLVSGLEAEWIMSLRLGWLLFSAGAAACGAPTSPTCDPYGRGPVVTYWLECAPLGSDVQCRLERRESGYCAKAAPEDVTAQATWTASDPIVAAVTVPGRFTPLAAGLLEIHARSGFQIASPEIAFTVAPGVAAERMHSLSIIASDTGGVRVPEVAVEIVPERGGRQACQTSNTGHCTLWVFQTTIQVTGTKAGYQSAQALAEPAFPGDSWYLRANLTMRPR